MNAAFVKMMLYENPRSLLGEILSVITPSKLDFLKQSVPMCYLCFSCPESGLVIQQPRTEMEHLAASPFSK